MERRTDPVELRRLATVAVGLGVLAQIAVPLIHGYGRTVVVITSVLALAAGACLHALSESGTALIATVVCLGVGGLLVEAIGVRVGLPFGSYDYTKGLGLALFGVPVVVPMAWMMLGWPAFVAGRKVGNAPLFGTGILVAWDLLLDPQMVKAGYWAWDPSSWPHINGIPISNSIGWAVVSAAMMVAMDRLVDVQVASDGLPLLTLAWTWFSSILGALVFGLSKASVGLVGGAALTFALAPVAMRFLDDVQRRASTRRRRPPRPDLTAGGGSSRKPSAGKRRPAGGGRPSPLE